ncbi:MAG TPA: late competence development ComFB family protein [Bacillota bacterium]|nr:late competence development ComFB family protein [Bacillota bacterium]
MKLINAMESIVIHAFDEFKKNHTFKCSCEKCELDILALTLNKLTPKYVSSDQGEVLVKAFFHDTQLQHDIIREIALATMTVENNPRH